MPKIFWVIGQATRTKNLNEEMLAKSHSHRTDAETSLRNRKFSLEAEVVVALAACDVAFKRMARKINWRRTIKEGETCKTGFLFHSLVMYYYLRLWLKPKILRRCDFSSCVTENKAQVRNPWVYASVRWFFAVTFDLVWELSCCKSF